MWILAVIGLVALSMGIFLLAIAVCNPDFPFRENKEVENDNSES